MNVDKLDQDNNFLPNDKSTESKSLEKSNTLNRVTINYFNLFRT
jgi:hypothetical protein